MPVFTNAPGRARGVARPSVAVAAALFLTIAPVAPALAQVNTVDPDKAIDADLSHGKTPAQKPPGELPSTGGSAPATANGTPMETGSAVGGDIGQNPSSAPTGAGTPTSTATSGPSAVPTYHEDDLIGAAEGVFGKGAKGLAGLIKDLLAKQGEPNAYIVGREAGGAIAVGLRYGSGTLYHKVEGKQPVYWTGPSIGFDAGANAASAFVLVYNLYDTEDLYRRFGAGEGQAYLVGGFTVSYLRRGNVVLIPVRSGAGLRLGANIGYMKFSHKQRWLPF